jgi:hypothetical protein
VSLAIPTAHIEPTHNFAIAGSVGATEDALAIGLGAAVRASDHLTFNGGIAVGTESGVVGGRAGFNVSW